MLANPWAGVPIASSSSASVAARSTIDGMRAPNRSSRRCPADCPTAPASPHPAPGSRPRPTTNRTRHRGQESASGHSPVRTAERMSPGHCGSRALPRADRPEKGSSQARLPGDVLRRESLPSRAGPATDHSSGLQLPAERRSTPPACARASGYRGRPRRGPRSPRSSHTQSSHPLPSPPRPRTRVLARNCRRPPAAPDSPTAGA